MGRLTEPFRQRTKDVLPAQQAVGEEIEAGLALDLGPAVEIRSKRRISRGLVGSAAVKPASYFYDLLGPRIKAMLIRKNLDRHSLSITGRGMHYAVRRPWPC